MATEKMTCQEYIAAFIANQNSKDEWRADHPDGMSIGDLILNDTVDIYVDDEDRFMDTDFEICIIDLDENKDVAYTI